MFLMSQFKQTSVVFLMLSVDWHMMTMPAVNLTPPSSILCVCVCVCVCNVIIRPRHVCVVPPCSLIDLTLQSSTGTTELHREELTGDQHTHIHNCVLVCVWFPSQCEDIMAGPRDGRVRVRWYLVHIMKVVQ